MSIGQIQREALAELIGTFMLVLVGAGAVAVTGDLVVAAFAHALILVAIITQYGRISGAHVNPAVTLAFLATGKIEAPKAGIFIVAQLLGGIIAAVVLRIVLADTFGAVNLGQTLPADSINTFDVFIVEFILTFFLVSSVFQAAVFERWGDFAPLLISFTLAGCILFGGPLTGASLNPARTLGPALLAEDMQNLGEVLLYFISILAGGVAAGFTQTILFAPNNDKS